MRALLVAALVLAVALAGCTQGPAGNPALRPPCVDSSPLRVEIQTDKERYFPGEVMNVTLVLNNTGAQPVAVSYRSWELSLKSLDGRAIRTYQREQDPDLGGANKTVPAKGRVVLEPRWPAFHVTRELYDPLPPGNYFLCAVLTAPDGSAIATGAKEIVAERQPVTI